LPLATLFVTDMIVTSLSAGAASLSGTLISDFLLAWLRGALKGPLSGA
jgi:hypothetical protein